MASTSDRAPISSKDLAVIFSEGLIDDGQGPGLAPEPIKRPRPERAALRRSGRIPVWVALIAGVLIGWLVIGWWLWPVHWTNSAPWDMSAKSQRTFVQLVADQFFQARDLAKAEAALEGWDRAQLNELLVAMQAQTIETDARQHLAALSDALSLPGGEQSLMDSIFSQDGIVIALLFAALPLLGAIGLVVVARVRTRATGLDGGSIDEQGEAELEELLAGVQLDGAPGPGGSQAPDEAEQQTDQPSDQEQKPPEEQLQQDEEEQENVDSHNPLGDLASLFEDEDTSLQTLEALSKGLPDCTADDLLSTAREIMRRFKEERPRR